MLHIVMYHYVRDLPRTAYPKIKGMLLDDFRAQTQELVETFEMATLESTLEYLQGRYHPKRDLCLITFDDGLKEHFTHATPILEELGVQALFHVITACLEDRIVASVHMNHFLMASLEFGTYQNAFLERLQAVKPEAANELAQISVPVARKTYPWDTADVAAFKYFFNFKLDAEIRDAVVKALFAEYMGSESEFAAELYVSWEEARQMQAAGMLIGGHTHRHQALSAMADSEMQKDLTLSTELLRRNLNSQALWPFCYPYGKRDSYTASTMATLKRLDYDCAFTTEKGPRTPGIDLFAIPRVDCKNAPPFEKFVRSQEIVLAGGAA